MEDLASLLRSLPSLQGPYGRFDVDHAPDEPQALFIAWFKQALTSGVLEPHAMTLSTVDGEGRPDARVLILKNLDEHGWHFAIGRSSPKGQQIARNPSVALSFYWQTLGRQVRIRGTANDMGTEVSRADFLARSVTARATALASKQSRVLADVQAMEVEHDAKRQFLEVHPQFALSDWTVYAVQADEVEFWQGDVQRRHVRLRYRRDPAGWMRERLYP